MRRTARDEAPTCPRCGEDRLVEIANDGQAFCAVCAASWRVDGAGARIKSTSRPPR
jgi:uncharacterized Zn finger protein (UPF0148 family)